MDDIARVGFARSVAERLFGSVVFSRHLPASSGGGKLIVSGKVGGLKYLFKSSNAWDPELLRVSSVLVRENDTVWDIGANVGLFAKSAAYLAGAGGCVYAIEADADAQVLLNRTISFASKDEAPITLLPVAVSNQVGWEIFAISRRARASNSLAGYGSSSTGGVLQRRTIPAVTLDKLLENFPPPDVLKVDVEGAEVKVFEGAKSILTTVRPMIYCEISGKNMRELDRKFRKSSYKFMNGEEVMSYESLYRANDKIGFNTVAVPEERVV